MAKKNARQQRKDDLDSLLDWVIQAEYDDFVGQLVDRGDEGTDEEVEEAIRSVSDDLYDHAYARACRLLYDAPKGKKAKGKRK